MLEVLFLLVLLVTSVRIKFEFFRFGRENLIKFLLAVSSASVERAFRRPDRPNRNSSFRRVNQIRRMNVLLRRELTSGALHAAFNAPDADEM